MKKYLGILIVFLFILTGCGQKETSIDVLKSVLKNDADVNSLTVKAKIDISVVEDGVSVDMPISADVKVDLEDEKNGKFYMILSDNPFIGEAELYVNMVNESMDVYMPSSLITAMIGIEDTYPSWIVETPDMNSEDEETIIDEENVPSVDEILEVITEEDFVYIDEDGDISHYQLKITDDLLKRLAEKLEEEYEETLETSFNIDIYIDIKNDVITKVELDMKQIVEDIMSSLENENNPLGESSINKLSFSIDFSNYNSTTVTIPNDIINNALTTEEYLQQIIGEE